MIRVSGVVWFTNLEIKKRHENLILYKKYTPEEYPKYDNYDAIEVGKTKDIPINYPGVM
jgi:Adenine-specific methyltransferase EcoRI